MSEFLMRLAPSPGQQSRLTRRLFLLLGLVLVVRPASAGGQSPAATSEKFSIEAGDVVRVRIWREPGLDGDFQVDEQGRLTLPLLGTRAVAGVPWLSCAIRCSRRTDSSSRRPR